MLSSVDLPQPEVPTIETNSISTLYAHVRDGAGSSVVAQAFPNRAKDERGRLLVGAASTIGDAGYERSMALIEAGNFKQLRDDLHRCKGGASLFGLERIVSLIGSCESPAVIEASGFDVVVFEKELTAAEQAVSAMTD